MQTIFADTITVKPLFRSLQITDVDHYCDKVPGKVVPMMLLEMAADDIPTSLGRTRLMYRMSGSKLLCTCPVFEKGERYLATNY